MTMSKFMLKILGVVAVVGVFAGAPAKAQGMSEAELTTRIATQLQWALAERMGLTADVSRFHVTLESAHFLPSISKIPMQKFNGIEILGLGTAGSRRLEGLMTLPIRIRGDLLQAETQMTAVVRVTGPVWTLKKNFTRDEIATGNDLQITELPWNTLPSAATSFRKETILGKRARAHYQAGSVVFEEMFDEPMDVGRGDVVDLTVVSGPGVMIRSRAVASQAGRRGDVIRIEVQNSKKPLQAVIVGNKTVEVKL